MCPIQNDQMRIFFYVPQAFAELGKNVYACDFPFDTFHFADKSQSAFFGQARHIVSFLTEYHITFARATLRMRVRFNVSSYDFKVSSQCCHRKKYMIRAIAKVIANEGTMCL